MRTPLLPAIIGLLAAGLSAACHAQNDTATLVQIRAALDAAERGTEPDSPLPAGHALAGWVEYADLRKRIDTLPPASGQAFLNRYRGQAAAETFREQWLAALAKREDWPAFRAACSASASVW